MVLSWLHKSLQERQLRHPWGVPCASSFLEILAENSSHNPRCSVIPPDTRLKQTGLMEGTGQGSHARCGSRGCPQYLPSPLYGWGCSIGSFLVCFFKVPPTPVHKLSSTTTSRKVFPPSCPLLFLVGRNLQGSVHPHLDSLKSDTEV